MIKYLIRVIGFTYFLFLSQLLLKGENKQTEKFYDIMYYYQFYLVYGSKRFSIELVE